MIKCYIIKYNEYAAFSVSKVTLRLGFSFVDMNYKMNVFLFIPQLTKTIGQKQKIAI